MRVPSLSTVRFAVLTALVLALFTSGIVVGAAGAPLILGQANGAGGKTTTLTSNKDNGPVFKLVNPGNNRGLDVETEVGVPLKLSGPTNKAPMVVNSGVNVTNLSADKVDGWHANSLVRIAFVNDDIIASGVNGRLTTTIEAPSRGWIAINGTGYIFNSSNSTADRVRCAIEVNNAEVTGSERGVDVDFLIAGDEMPCASTAGFRVCSPGTYVIDMEFTDVGADVFILDGSLTAQFSPFSGAGSLPPLLSCIPIVTGDQGSGHPAKE